MRNRAGVFGSKDGNCALYGCAAVVLLGMAVVIVVGVVMKQAFDRIKEEFTAAEAVELPTVENNEETVSRLDTWRESLESGEGKTALVLTEEDINVLIQHHPDMEWLAGKVHVSIEGSDITGDMSFPLDEIPGFSGRYFNGSATFDLSLDNGRLYFYLSEASVKGEPVPEEVMASLRSTNLAEDMNRDPQFQDELSSLSSISITDGVVKILPSGVDVPADSESSEEAEVVEEEPVAEEDAA